MKNRSNLCKWPDCLKYIQSNCHGYCLTHVKYADYMGSSGGGGGEGEFGAGMMGGGAEDTADYDDDLLYEVTKVRVRVQQRLQNGFCRAILPMELRDKWGFVRGGGEEEEEEEEDYGVNPGMPGREDDHDEYSEDDGRRGTMFLGEADERGGNVDENDDDDEPAFAAADATAAALPRMDGDLHDENGEIDAPQRIDGEDAEPGFRAADANDAAAARSSGKKFSDDMLDFPVSSTPVKKFNGSLKCRAVSCPKNCQGNSDGFCRAHHNQYLICTGQCDSWVCICGNKIVDFMARCGACHRWRGGKHPLSSSLPAAKRLKNNAGAAVEMAGDQAGTVDDVGGIRSSLTYVPPDAAAQISEKQLTNGSGRALCKVIGCGKLDQSNNDGFCRTHFNMFAVEGADSDLDGWTCVCGQSMSGKQKRCGSCNKVKPEDNYNFVMHHGSSHSLLLFLCLLSNSGEGVNATRTKPTRVTVFPKKASSTMTTTVSHGRATAATLYPPPNLDAVVVTIGEEASAKAGGSWGPLEGTMTATMAWIGLWNGRAAARPYPHSKLDAESAMAGEVGSALLVELRQV
jgi:hypothetical protein